MRTSCVCFRGPVREFCVKMEAVSRFECGEWEFVLESRIRYCVN